MRHNPHHDETDEAVVRRLLAEHPWGTLVSSVDGVPVASHYPLLIDDERDELTLLTHVGKPDEQLHRFGEREVLVIAAGEHGYVSPSWYEPGDTRAPTWNFTTAHLYGVPEVLDFQENLDVLTKLVAHFERHVEVPVHLDRTLGERLSRGTVGLRIPITRWTCKVKMSQDKQPGSRRNVLDALRGGGPYAHPALADEMERALAEEE